MESEDSLQDLIRCNLCDTPAPALFCDICAKYLCKDCERKHLSDRSKDHNVVSVKCRRSIPKCPKHSLKICNDYCKHCNIPICGQCFFSEEHVGHKKIDLKKNYEDQRSILENDLEELENNIYPFYKGIASEILQQKTDHIENSRIVTTTIEKHKEDWHRTIDVITNELKSDFDKIDNRIQAFLNKQSNEITQELSQITKRITSLKEILKSKDFSLISEYESNETEFRKLPSKHTFSLPSFTSKKIDRETIYKLFGSLSAITTNPKEQGNASDVLEALQKFAIKPVIVTEIITECLGIRNVSYLSNGQMWACSYQENVIRLYNLKSELQMTITTKSGNRPSNIAVTENEDLVYTDDSDGTINIARGKKIQPLIKIRGWKPCSICTSNTGELLAFIVSDDNKQSKVVRYSGSTEKQSIQYDDKGHPLYSTDGLGVIDIAYVSENRNFDICVSDCVARAVVVVNQAGKMRFTYTGIPYNTRETFYPYGISSDSQGHILIAEGYNNHIHILNQDGLFLSYIGNCELKLPRGLCVDTRDNLFVAEYGTEKVKKIQHYK